MLSVNKPQVSRTIALSYCALLIFLAAFVTLFTYAALFTPMGIIPGAIASLVSVFVGLIIFTILVSLYRTRYILTKKNLVIKTTKLIGGSKTIPLQKVSSVEKTMIPFGIRLFGASFHGGYYHIPSLGRTFLTITNFNDGLLIRTDTESYIITPSQPTEFKASLKRLIESIGADARD